MHVYPYARRNDCWVQRILQKVSSNTHEKSTDHTIEFMSSFEAHFSDGPETPKNAKNPYEEFHEPINKVCLCNQNEHFS